MRVFLFEFVCGGGFYHPSMNIAPKGSLRAEGEAMWQALLEDFSAIPDAHVTTTRDDRLESVVAKENQTIVPVGRHSIDKLLELAAQSDFSLLLAPEFDNHLIDLVAAFEQANIRLLGPNLEFVRWASDKTATCEDLAAAGVRTPNGQLLKPGSQLPRDLKFPVVAKRNDGAGSMVGWVREWRGVPWEHATRIEPYIEGKPCSQSVLLSELTDPVFCPPMHQTIAESDFAYCGGHSVCHEDEIARCEALTREVVAALPRTNGYIGIDMILGSESDGSKDYAIEVNPRITFSYTGIRPLAKQNLAMAMIDLAEGRTHTVSFDPPPVVFAIDGTTFYKGK